MWTYHNLGISCALMNFLHKIYKESFLFVSFSVLRRDDQQQISVKGSSANKIDEYCLIIQDNVQKWILNAVTALIQSIIMEKKQIPLQPPFNPYMFPFPFPYPPPPFINPMMNMPPKPNPVTGHQQAYPPHGPPMPPFGFPHFPMMYPPPPDLFYRFHEQKKPPQDISDLNTQQQNKERPWTKEDPKKKLGGPAKLSQKKPNEIIILSDDESGVKQVLPVQNFAKKYVENKINISIESKQDSKPLKVNKKVVPAPKPEPFIKKTRLIEKKREPKIIKQKQDNQSFDVKQARVTPPTSTQIPHEHYSRVTRLKLLTIKQGKGKIMIGDEFQASIPQFATKDQSYSVWLLDVKKNLISRFQKDGL